MLAGPRYLRHLFRGAKKDFEGTPKAAFPSLPTHFRLSPPQDANMPPTDAQHAVTLAFFGSEWPSRTQNHHKITTCGCSGPPRGPAQSHPKTPNMQLPSLFTAQNGPHAHKTTIKPPLWGTPGHPRGPAQSHFGIRFTRRKVAFLRCTLHFGLVRRRTKFQLID